MMYTESWWIGSGLDIYTKKMHILTFILKTVPPNLTLENDSN